MSEDLIKREDAIKALRLEYPMMPMFKNLREEWAIKTEGFRKAEEVIMSIPSADRPQGKWKHESDCGITKCKKCGWSIEECIDWNYCPNCGARMFAKDINVPNKKGAEDD